MKIDLHRGIGNDVIRKSLIGNVRVLSGPIPRVSSLSEPSRGSSNFKRCNRKSASRCHTVVLRCGIGLPGKCNVSEDHIYIYMYTENSTGNLLIYEPFMAFI